MARASQCQEFGGWGWTPCEVEVLIVALTGAERPYCSDSYGGRLKPTGLLVEVLCTMLHTGLLISSITSRQEIAPRSCGRRWLARRPTVEWRLSSGPHSEIWDRCDSNTGLLQASSISCCLSKSLNTAHIVRLIRSCPVVVNRVAIIIHWFSKKPLCIMATSLESSPLCSSAA